MTPFIAERLQHESIAIAGMNNNGQPGFATRVKVPLEVSQLDVQRAIIPVLIEPRFAECNDPIIIEQAANRVPVPGYFLVSVIGMDTCGEVETQFAFLGCFRDERHAFSTGLGIHCDADDSIDLRSRGAAQYLGQLGEQRLIRQMRVRIDPGNLLGPKNLLRLCRHATAR